MLHHKRMNLNKLILDATPGQLINSSGNTIQGNTEKEQISHSKVFTGKLIKI